MRNLTLTAVLALAIAGQAAFAQSAPSYPAVTNLRGTYSSGRTVQLTWSNPGSSMSATTHCDVYRDGEVIYTGVLRQNDTETGGQTWFGSNTQYFRDRAAFPGRTHAYSVVYRTEDGRFSEPGAVSVAVPMPTVSQTGFTAVYRNGRVVRLTTTFTSNFPELTYEIHRDGQKIAECPRSVAGGAQNGDTWTNYTTSFVFDDHHGFPGQTHVYRIVFRLFEGCSFQEERTVAVPMPTLGQNALILSHATGRSVRLRTDFQKHFPDLVFEIHRDGEKVAECPQNTNGTLDNGDFWTTDGAWFAFTDTHAFPGRTHTYRLVFRLFEGCSVEMEKEIAVPMPSVGSSIYYVKYQNGRNVQVGIQNFTTYFPELTYEIYRDDEKLAEVSPSTEGSLENGDNWHQTDTAWFFFYDTHARPGQTHVYRVVFRLFDGCWFEQTRQLAIPMPEAHISDIMINRVGARTIRLLMLSRLAGFPELTYHIYRNGVKLAEFPHGADGALENGDSWVLNKSTYFYDVHGVPGATYTYKILINLYDDVCLEYEKSISIPKDRLSNNFVSAINRQEGVELCIPRIYGDMDGVSYEIFRNGLSLGRIADDENGVTDDGNSYRSEHSKQYFIDVNADFGARHNYRIILWCGDIQMNETTASVHTDPAGVSHASSLYLPVVAQLESGEYLLAATVEMFHAEAAVATVSGAGAVFVDNGLSTLSLKREDFPDNGRLNLYILVRPDIILDTTSVNLKCIPIAVAP